MSRRVARTKPLLIDFVLYSVAPAFTGHFYTWSYMNQFFESDLDWMSKEFRVLVNDQPYCGKIAVGDTLEINNHVYAVLGINEDAIIVKEIKLGS